MRHATSLSQSLPASGLVCWHPLTGELLRPKQALALGLDPLRCPNNLVEARREKLSRLAMRKQVRRLVAKSLAGSKFSDMDREIFQADPRVITLASGKRVPSPHMPFPFSANQLIDRDECEEAGIPHNPQSPMSERNLSWANLRGVPLSLIASTEGGRGYLIWLALDGSWQRERADISRDGKISDKQSGQMDFYGPLRASVLKMLPSLLRDEEREVRRQEEDECGSYFVLFDSPEYTGETPEEYSRRCNAQAARHGQRFLDTRRREAGRSLRLRTPKFLGHDLDPVSQLFAREAPLPLNQRDWKGYTRWQNREGETCYARGCRLGLPGAEYFPTDKQLWTRVLDLHERLDRVGRRERGADKGSKKTGRMGKLAGKELEACLRQGRILTQRVEVDEDGVERASTRPDFPQRLRGWLRQACLDASERIKKLKGPFQVRQPLPRHCASKKLVEGCRLIGTRWRSLRDKQPATPSRVLRPCPDPTRAWGRYQRLEALRMTQVYANRPVARILRLA